jgi:hypothetical protein
MSVPVRAAPIYQSDRVPASVGPLNATIVHLDGRPYEAQSSMSTAGYASEKLTMPRPESVSEGRTMADHPTREELKGEIALVEARTDTKFARMEGKLDLVLSKLDGVRDDNRATRANQWVIGLGLAVLMVAIAGLFPVFFGIGSQVRDLVHSEIQSQSPRQPAPR